MQTPLQPPERSTPGSDGLVPAAPGPVPVEAGSAEAEAVGAEPIVEGAPVRRSAPGLSPSRANDFLQCPLLFRFRVVDRLPEPPSAAAVRGTLVHAVLEHLFDLPAGQRTLEAAHAMLPHRWHELLAEHPGHAELFEHQAEWDEWLASAGRLLDTYFTLEDPNRLQPHEREMSVRTQLDDGPQLRGIVDRLDVAPGGAMRVVDYKTGRSPRAGYEGTALFQMRFYAFMLWRERGELPRMLQLVYLGDGTILRHEPTEPEMLSLEARVRSIWSGIEETARSGDWRPRKSRLCDWCAHRDLCPAFGGTPPEIPEGAVRLALGVEPAPAN